MHKGQRALVVEDFMPNTPLFPVKEAETGNVELVLEQAQVSVPSLLVWIRALGFTKQGVIDFPIPLYVDVAKLRAHTAALFVKLPAH